MGKRVKFSLDADAVPPITDEERAELLRLSDARGDEGIDFSDIPDNDEGYTGVYTRGRFFRPVKQQITLRLDANVIDWFKRRTPKGYQTDINQALRDYISEHDKKAG